ncbi:MAG: DUF4129 domain-containing protein [Acidimicrobiales bacterium]
MTPLILVGRVLAQGVRTPEHDPDDVDRLADDILGRAEFQPPERTWLRRQWDRFADWLRSLFDDGNEQIPEADIPTEAASGGGPGSLVAYLLLAAVLVLAAWVIWRVVKHRPPRAVSDDDPDVTIDIDEHRSSSDWRSRAEALAADGQWKESVRAWLRWGVASLIDRDVLEDVPGRTTGEFRRSVADDHPDLQADFDRASLLFDEVWYADRPATAETVESMRRDIEAVVEQAPRRHRSRRDDSTRPMAEIS